MQPNYLHNPCVVDPQAPVLSAGTCVFPVTQEQKQWGFLRCGALQAEPCTAWEGLGRTSFLGLDSDIRWLAHFCTPLSPPVHTHRVTSCNLTGPLPLCITRSPGESRAVTKPLCPPGPAHPVA